MEPAEIFDAVRAAYLNAFVSSIGAQTNGASEVLIQPCLHNPESRVPRTPTAKPFRVPMRQDIVPMKDGSPQAVMVVRGPEQDFLPITWELDGGFQLALGPFTWDDVRLVVFGLPRDVDFRSLIDWFQTWADLNDEEEPDAETGLRLLVHYVEHIDDPRMPEEATAFELDMGTAPAVALTEFLDRLAELGATTV